MVYSNNVRIQREYRRLQQQLIENENMGQNAYQTYLLNTSTEKNSSSDDAAVCVNGTNIPTAAGSKNIKISVKHNSQTTTHEHQKKILQFSFDTDTKKKGDENVINIDVSDLP